MSKKLVAYFSASGTTAAVAKTLSEAAEADLYAIKPQTPYTRAYLDWMNKKSRSSVEMNNKTHCPPLADKNAHIEDYDTIFLGLLTKSKGNYKIPLYIVTIGVYPPFFGSTAWLLPIKTRIYYTQRNQRSTIKNPVLLRSTKSKVNYYSK